MVKRFQPHPDQIIAGAVALTLGFIGAMIARWVGTPLPMLTGSVLSVGIAALMGFKPFGVAPRLPTRIRLFFVPILGVAIGSALSPQILDHLLRWWPTFAMLLVFIPGVHMMSYGLIRATAPGVDKVTAFFATSPGGLTDSIIMGELYGGDEPLITMIQLMRLILTILLVPLGFSIAEGHMLGSAGGVTIGDASHVTGFDWLVLGLCAIGGAWGAKLLKLPAGWIFGPMVVSGIVHITGLIESAPPSWLVGLVQLVIGTSIGGRFYGRTPRIFLTGFRLAIVNLTGIFLLAAAAAFALHGVVGERWEAVFLAYAPGGLAEMSLVALSLEISIVYVSVHHMVRVMISITFMRLAWAYLIGPGKPPPENGKP